tara:strand:+ start:1933 stop:2109 length:177 start_codon:yes stop_codon:yes gene_type:complete
MDKLVELYCDVDDFFKVFIPQWQKQLLDDGTQKHQRDGRMTTSRNHDHCCQLSYVALP